MLNTIEQRLKNHQRQILGYKDLKKYAVLVPLIEQSGEISVGFEVRAKQMRRQPGEICFPGGKVDEADRSDKDAAIRETSEELGLPKEDIEVIGDLDILINMFGFTLSPFVGKLLHPERIAANKDEVEEIFFVPLCELRVMKPDLHYIDIQARPPEEFPFERIPNGKNYRWRTGKVPEYFYEYEGKVIWGMTARILHHFLEVTSG